MNGVRRAEVKGNKATPRTPWSEDTESGDERLSYDCRSGRLAVISGSRGNSERCWILALLVPHDDKTFHLRPDLEGSRALQTSHVTRSPDILSFTLCFIIKLS